MISDTNFKNISIKELAEIIGNQLVKHNIEVVLVGGACVSIYTNNKYKSYDLDFISYESVRKIKIALAEIGFEYDKMKYYKHPDCEYILEFLAPPIAIGNEQIDKFNTLSSPLGTVKILTPTDCVKDRLAAYIYWDDRQSLQQAIMVAKEQQIDLDDIKFWAKNEESENKLKDFFDKI